MTIQKQILRDENEQPVAVVVPYEEWVKLSGEKPKVVPRFKNINDYAGCVTWDVDPLEFQNEVREDRNLDLLS